MLTEQQADELLRDGSIEDIMAVCYKDLGFFSRLIFPDQFTRPFSYQHEALFEALDDRSLKQLLVIAFRGIGKTTIIQLAFAAREILFRDSKFLVNLSCSNTLAVMQSEGLKARLMTNKAITNFWGNIKSENRENPFSKDFWVTDSGMIVLPRGAGQQVLGLNYMSTRPDLLLTDDLENPNELKTEESQQALNRWFFNDYINIVDRGYKKWRHIVMGTIHGSWSILIKLKESKDWDCVELKLCDDKCHSLWPSYMPDNEVKELKESFRDKGELGAFYRQYMNTLIPGEDADFIEDYFKYYDPSEIDLNKFKNAESVILVDPAKTTNISSAESAIVGVGVGTRENKFWVRDVIARKMHPEELYNEALDMATRLHARVIGVEVTSLEDFIKHPFLDAMHQRGLYFEFVWLKAVGKKEQRIRELKSYYRQGLVFHNKAATGALEEQLLSFPLSRRFDIMDALAYLPVLLEEGERYFSFYGTETEKDIEAEFADLEDDFEDKEAQPSISGWWQPSVVGI
jgi:hypothetical protein